MRTPTHIAAIGTTADVVSDDVCDLVVVTARPEPTWTDGHEDTQYLATTDTVSSTNLDHAPLDDPDKLDLAQSEADLWLAATGWDRLTDWEIADNALYAQLAPTHGLISVTLYLAGRHPSPPGQILGDPSTVTVPGLAEHPRVSELRAAAGPDMVVRILPANATISGFPAVTVTLPLAEPAPNGVHHYADMHTEQHAESIARHPALIATGRTVGQAGTHVWLTRAALDVLGDLPATTDGHFDGTNIWIGTMPHIISQLTVDDLTTITRCPGCGSLLPEIRANTESVDGNPCTDAWHENPEQADDRHPSPCGYPDVQPCICPRVAD